MQNFDWESKRATTSESFIYPFSHFMLATQHNSQQNFLCCATRTEFLTNRSVLVQNEKQPFIRIKLNNTLCLSFNFPFKYEIFLLQNKFWCLKYFAQNFKILKNPKLIPVILENCNHSPTLLNLGTISYFRSQCVQYPFENTFITTDIFQKFSWNDGHLVNIQRVHVRRDVLVINFIESLNTFFNIENFCNRT